MELKIITETNLREKLSLHKQWILAFEQQITVSLSDRLCLFDTAISGVKLFGEDLCSAEIVRCHLEDSSFENCRFSDSILVGTTLNNCNFFNCNFIETDLRGLDCNHTSFVQSDFTSADFTEATLTECSFRDCDLSWTWLIKTNLRSTLFKNINIEGARFSNTKISNLSRKNLIKLEQATIKSIDVRQQDEYKTLSGTEALDFLKRDRQYTVDL